MNNNINILTQNKVLEDLKISRSTLFRYRKDLGLEHFKIGGKTYYDIDKIKEFMHKFSSHLQNTTYVKK